MATREAFLDHLWREVIDALSRDRGLDNIIANCKRFPDDAFSGTGPAIERMLAAGVSRQDLCLVMRCTAYEAVHGTLYALSDPGVDDDVDASALYEELGMAEPRGMDGRSDPEAGH
jgi:hypothetical protein